MPCPRGAFHSFSCQELRQMRNVECMYRQHAALLFARLSLHCRIWHAEESSPVHKSLSSHDRGPTLNAISSCIQSIVIRLPGAVDGSHGDGRKKQRTARAYLKQLLAAVLAIVAVQAPHLA